MTSWIDDFLDYTSDAGAPRIFRQWSGITAISGVLGRCAWIHTKKGPTYPNLYTLLIGGPGAGKGLCTAPVHQLWKQVNNFTVAPSSITRAGIEDAFLEALKVTEINPQQRLTHHTLLISAAEFVNLCDAQDQKWFGIMNDVWDCLPYYKAQTRSKGVVDVQNPCMVMLAGIQPVTMNEVFPSRAFGGGFISRLMMVYATKEDEVFSEVFGERRVDPSAWRNLVAGLERVCRIRGEFDWERDAMERIEELNKNKLTPIPEHPRLLHYNARRLHNLLKLTMIYCASDYSNIIRRQHVEQGWQAMLQMEAQLPKAMAAMSFGAHGTIEDEVVIWLREHGIEGKTNEWDVVRYLQPRVHANSLHFVLNSLERSGRVRFEQSKVAGLPRCVYVNDQ